MDQVLTIPRHFMVTMLRYLRWAREVCPTSATKTIEVLEKATNALKDIDELRNDVRHIQLWIEYVIICFLKENYIIIG